MAKRRKVEVVDLAEWPIGPDFNWSLCVICQAHTGQPLITATADGCRSLAENLNAFSKSGSLPSSVHIQNNNINNNNNNNNTQICTRPMFSQDSENREFKELQSINSCELQ